MTDLDARPGVRDFKKAAYTVLICLLVGPFVGSIFIQGVVWIAKFATEGPSFEILKFAVVYFFPLIAIGYFVGGLTAVFGGAVLAAYGYFKGRPPLWFPLAVMVLPALIGFVANPIDETWRVQDVRQVTSLFGASVFAAVACWYAVVRILYKAPA